MAPKKVWHVTRSVKKRGRPVTRKIEIHATAEEIAKAIFAAAKPPDPTLRIAKRPKAGESTLILPLTHSLN